MSTGVTYHFGSTVILKKTIRGTVNPNVVYGTAGEIVKVISDRIDVLIVEDVHQKRFSVCTIDVTENPADKIVKDETPVMMNKIPAKPKRKVKIELTKSLFD